MKKLFFVALILVSVPLLASDFKWNHTYQQGCSVELLSVAGRVAGTSAARSAPSEGFAVNRPAFILNCGKGTVSWEVDEQKIVRGLFFEGPASFSFSVSDPLEQTRLERYIGKKSIENRPLKSLYIIPVGECPDLPAMPATGATTVQSGAYVEFKQSLRRGLFNTLYDLLNTKLMDPRDIIVIFEMENDIWAYRFDSQSETEVSLLRLAHPPSQNNFFWDPAVAIHEKKGGALTPDVTSEEMEAKIFADAKSYDINLTLDGGGNILKSEIAVKVFLKKPHHALLFDYFPEFKVDRVSVDGEEAYFMKENYSELWGYYENGLLVGFKTPKEGEVTLKFTTSGDLFKQGDGYLYMWDEDLWYPHLDDWDGASYKITVTVPKENEVIAVGDLRSHATNPDSSETYVWESEIPIKLATFVFGKFIHKKMDAEGLSLDVALPKGVRSNLLTQAQDYTLNELKNNIIFYSKTFGPLPYSNLKVAVTPYSHGRGFPTMLLITDAAFFRYGSTWPDQLMAHEVAHQWWGNLVDGLSYRDLWLSEGMAEFASMTYMGLRFGEDKVKLYHENMLLGGTLLKESSLGSTLEADEFRPAPPSDPFRPLGMSVDMRVPFDEGPICMGRRLYSTMTTRPSEGYNYVIYTKGNFVFQMLLALSKFTKEGSAGFYKGLQSICVKYKGQRISTPLFFKELQDSMKVPLSSFLKSWYEGTGIPKVEVKTTPAERDGKYFLTAEGKTDMDFFFGVPVRVTAPDKKKYDYVLVFQNKAAKSEWPVAGKPKDIDVDPMRVVFCTYGKVKD